MRPADFRRPLSVLVLCLTLLLLTLLGAARTASGVPTQQEGSTPDGALTRLHVPAGVSPMTDIELRRKDPAAFGQITAERQRAERVLKSKVHRMLKARGLPYGRRMTPQETAAVQAALSSTPWSPYGFLKFRLVAGSGDWSYNGYRGILYFTWGTYYASGDLYKWYTVSWPAISGNNRPPSQSVVNVGPIPEYTWDFGFIGGSWQGYRSNGSADFYPGEWRLDPWTGAPYGRCYFETHGGAGSHYFKPTHGCIRLTPSNIGALKTCYDTRMANKKDRSTAHLTVDY